MFHKEGHRIIISSFFLTISVIISSDILLDSATLKLISQSTFLIFYSLIIGQSGWTFLKLLMIPAPFLVSFFIGWFAVYIISWIIRGFFD